MTELAPLRKLLRGEVIEPDAPEYEATRRPAMERFRHIRPRAVVRCACAEDVARTLLFAKESGLHVVPRGGGHCFAGRSSTEGIVLDLAPMRSVSVARSGEVAVATIGAGARLAEVYDALDEHGLTLPAGCGATVGIAGLTLGGGLGLLGRRYGLTCDRLRAATVVLADGRIVDCEEHREPELFWALRGAGGGQFGVVTSLVFDAVPAREATRFELTWPLDDAVAVIAAWQEWAPDAPDELSATLKVGGEGAGAPVQVVLFGAMLGTEIETAALIGELVTLVGAQPQAKNLAVLPYNELKRSPAGTEPPGPEVSRSEFFRRPLPVATITSLLSETPDQPWSLNFIPMGGAYNRVPADATAFVHRAERFLLEQLSPDAHWVRQSWATTHPWGSGRVYPNFPDPDLTNWADAYHGANHARLVQVKRRYDREHLFQFPQSI